MPGLKYRVSLTEEEKEMLESLLRKGKSAARKQTRARILLKAAVGSKEAEIDVSKKEGRRHWKTDRVQERCRS